MSNVDHAAKLTELLGVVDERFQAALHAGIARLATSQVTPSPHQRAEAIMATSPRPNCENEEWWVNQITTAIQEASNDTLERGRKRTAEVQAALQAALEDLAKANSALTSEQIAYGKTMQERDGLAAQIERIMIGGNHLASALIHWLGAGEDTFPPYTESCENARKAIQDLNIYDAWIAWKSIMLARDSDMQSILAAHDRAVAARVLRSLGSIVMDILDWEAIRRIADQYERGEREVPSE